MWRQKKLPEGRPGYTIMPGFPADVTFRIKVNEFSLCFISPENQFCFLSPQTHGFIIWSLRRGHCHKAQISTVQFCDDILLETGFRTLFEYFK